MSTDEVPLIAQHTTGACPPLEQIEAVLARWRQEPPDSMHRARARDMVDMLTWLVEARREADDAGAELAAVLELVGAHELLWASAPTEWGPPVVKTSLVRKAATHRSG